MDHSFEQREAYFRDTGPHTSSQASPDPGVAFYQESGPEASPQASPNPGTVYFRDSGLQTSPQTSPQAFPDPGLEVYHRNPGYSTNDIRPPQNQQPQQEWKDPTFPEVYTVDAEPKKRIAGLERLPFWIIAVLIIALIIAAVGGGVGGSVAANKAREGCSPTATKPMYTPTNTNMYTGGVCTPIAPSLIPMIDKSCPPSSSPLKSFYEDEFTCAEGKDIQYFDIIGIIAYTLQACIDACAVYNNRNAAKNCAAIVMSADLSDSYTKQGANCWLKSKASDDVVEDDVRGTLAILCKGDCPT